MSRTLFRSHTNLSLAVLNPFPHSRFLRCCSSFAVDAVSFNGDGGEVPEPPAHHPWPEWVSFVDRLKSKGYFTAISETSQIDVGEGGGESMYKTMDRLKDPCIKFGRDKRDILKSLSRKDIQTVVRCGCPNLLQKAVNSAKRLRAYVQLDEADVCSACSLRGSCDRANLVLKESEGLARTVDIVRILLFYALDPLVYREYKPPGRVLVEAATRKLLSELIQLSETPPNPAYPQTASKASAQKEETVNNIGVKLYQDVESRSGDWICPQCNFLNFSRNRHCRECKKENSNVYAAKKAVAVKFDMKKGDWSCLLCECMNFGRTKFCIQCRGPRPARNLQPGEWECPTCDIVNIKWCAACWRCNTARPT